MKNVLLLIHDDAGQEARLQAALDVTRALRGHLNCLDVIVMPAIAGEDIGFSGRAMLLNVEKRQERANRKTIQKRLATENVPWDWADTHDELEPAIRIACVGRSHCGQQQDRRPSAAGCAVRRRELGNYIKIARTGRS